MIEFGPVPTTTIVCCATRTALDALQTTVSHGCRVAPDELMLVCAEAAGAEVLAHARAKLASSDPDALVLDVSAGWSVWSLAGDDAHAGFARLSAVPLAAGFAQGAVAGVPARVLAAGDRILIFTASTLSRHMARRIGEACTDLGVRPIARAAFPPGDSR